MSDLILFCVHARAANDRQQASSVLTIRMDRKLKVHAEVRDTFTALGGDGAGGHLNGEIKRGFDFLDIRVSDPQDARQEEHN